MTFVFIFFFIFIIQGHNPCLALQLACNWVTRQPWLEATVVRGPRSSARARSGKGQGHHFQSVGMTLMGYDKEGATRFAMPHNICNLPLPQYAGWSYWAVTHMYKRHSNIHTHHVNFALLSFQGVSLVMSPLSPCVLAGPLWYFLIRHFSFIQTDKCSICSQSLWEKKIFSKYYY